MVIVEGEWQFWGEFGVSYIVTNGDVV